MTEEMVCRIETSSEKERYIVYMLGGKIDSWSVIDTKYQHQSEYKRWDIDMHLPVFEKALYTVAKQQPEKFKFMYQELKEKDEKFFEIARKTLRKIKAEYNFS